jgi:membrane protein
MANRNSAGTLLKEVAAAVVDDAALSRSAAISFYAISAMVPILYICVMLAGLVLGPGAARSGLLTELGNVVGYDSAELLQRAVHRAATSLGGFWPGLIGTVVFVLTAGGVFVEVQSALNAIWKAAPRKTTLLQFLRSWAESLAVVLALGVLLVASLLVNAGISALGSRAEDLLGVGGWLAWLAGLTVSSLLIAILFGTIYIVLPNRELHWRDVMFGAAVTTVLFQVGEYVISVYLGMSAAAHRFGALGGAIVVLTWIYYSVLVFLLGAEITKAWSAYRR